MHIGQCPHSLIFTYRLIGSELPEAKKKVFISYCMAYVRENEYAVTVKKKRKT